MDIKISFPYFLYIYEWQLMNNYMGLATRLVCPRIICFMIFVEWLPRQTG